MSNLIGIRTTSLVTPAVAIASSATLITVGLTTPIAANQRIKIRAWIEFSVGATGGVRSLLAVPVGATYDAITTKLYNTVAPSLTTSVVSTVFTNALANAGSHFLEIEANILNGATAGTLDLQIAQNTSDVLTLTVLRGSTMDVVKLN